MHMLPYSGNIDLHNKLIELGYKYYSEQDSYYNSKIGLLVVPICKNKLKVYSGLKNYNITKTIRQTELCKLFKEEIDVDDRYFLL